MALRRAALLILGVMGSLLTVAVLYTSGRGILTTGVSAVPEEQSAAEGLELPFFISDTTLIARRLTAYDGPFLEDGWDREVVGVAALHVRNIGTQEVLNTCVIVQLGECILTFYGEHIPPGADVLLLEYTGKAYPEGKITACTGCQSTALTDLPEGILVAERAMGTLVVTNTTDKAFENMRLYYKAWLSPPDIYVGGIAYMTEIPVLQPGETKYLYPDHYACGYSKVVSITTDS